MIIEIQSTFTNFPDIYGVFGFGSYFRGELFNDIDILVVVIPSCDNTLELFYQVREELDKIAGNIDLTLLTYKEFNKRPLLEHDELTEIYKVT